jgi:SAM-dependent methyltransferase
MAHWDHLHELQRFRPVYPNERVVRFLVASRSVFDEQSPPRFLDIGTGAGRHAKLAAELGFEAFGTDISFTGLDHARKRLHQSGFPAQLLQASTLAFPFETVASRSLSTMACSTTGWARNEKSHRRNVQNSRARRPGAGSAHYG